MVCRPAAPSRARSAGIGQQPLELVHPLRRRRRQKPVHAVLDDVPVDADRRRHDRHAARHELNRLEPAFPPRPLVVGQRVDADVAGVEQLDFARERPRFVSAPSTPGISNGVRRPADAQHERTPRGAPRAARRQAPPDTASSSDCRSSRPPADRRGSDGRADESRRVHARRDRGHRAVVRARVLREELVADNHAVGEPDDRGAPSARYFSDSTNRFASLEFLR